MDFDVISTVCNLYASDGVYVINATQHSPLLGFAYDGYPIYGAYGYVNVDGTGGITRMKSSYTLRNITTRTTYSTGASVTAGPAVNTTYPLGYFREDYQYAAPTQADYLDDHNGRFCVTPEYPTGTYAYFCTVDANHNSAYPYAVGPTFYGNKVVTKVTTVPGTATTYTGPILPVESLSFDGYCTDNKVILKWTTAAEKNNCCFEIESSNSGIEFSKIGKVTALGNTVSTSSYSFVDNSSIVSVKYYRLKQIDNNGKSNYSKTIAIHNNYKGTELSVFPNPVADLLILQAKGNVLTNSLDIQLINTNGQVIKKQQFLQGSTICYIQTKDIANGSYFVCVADGNYKKTYKIVIEH